MVRYLPGSVVSEGSEITIYSNACKLLVTDTKILEKLIALGSYDGEEINWPAIVEVA